MSEALRYVCPFCKGELTSSASAYRCESCARTYPVVLGIPDFRIFADPYISVEDDYEKGGLLEGAAGTCTFAELVERYWELTPGVPASLVREYVRTVVDSRERAEAIWAAVRGEAGGRHGTLLDVGCGAGGLLAEAAAEVYHAVGIDIAFRWLIVARKRLRELGIANADLVCACAEALPFPNGAFSIVTADDLLDHTRDPGSSVQEGVRVLRAGGSCFLTTPNRFSLAPDPHVRVWGVGFLPARLRNRFVRWRRGIDYGPIRPISYVAFRRILRQAPACRWRIVPAPVLGLSSLHLPSPLGAAAAAYNRVRSLPMVRNVFFAIGPGLRALGVKVTSRDGA